VEYVFEALFHPVIGIVKTAVNFPGVKIAAPASGSLFLTLRVRNPCPLALRRVLQYQSPDVSNTTKH
jgi:hypothetical protein